MTDEGLMARRTILVIDDTPDHLDLLRRLLGAVGYDVIAVPPSTEAMCQADRRKPDLILMALSLPGQSSWELARQLASRGPHAPILGTTVYSTLLGATRIRSLGCADVVEKPFDFDVLLDRISRLLPDSSQAAYAA